MTANHLLSQHGLGGHDDPHAGRSPPGADLEEARNESQVSKAVGKIKHGIPESLMIMGQNPLTLLHGPLSHGIHDMSDDECLSIATSIRHVLIEFAEKLGAALKEQAELDAAVANLLSNRATRGDSETGDRKSVV